MTQRLMGANLSAWPVAAKGRGGAVDSLDVARAGVGGLLGGLTGFGLWKGLGDSKQLIALVKQLGALKGQAIVAAAGAVSAAAAVLVADGVGGDVDLEALARGGNAGAVVAVFEHVLFRDTSLVGPALVAIAVEAFRRECA